MKALRLLPVVAVAAFGVLGLMSCQKKASGPIAWGTAGYDAALAEASQRKTLVMVDFYTDW